MTISDQLEEVTARAEISKTPPSLMFGPVWRVGPSCVVSDVLEKGPEVPPWSDIARMGLRSLRLLRHSSWGQCRLCLCRQVQGVTICSPRSACIVSLRCTEPHFGPVVMTSAGTNHGCGLVVLQGQSRARENGKWRQWTAVSAGAWWTRARRHR